MAVNMIALMKLLFGMLILSLSIPSSVKICLWITGTHLPDFEMLPTESARDLTDELARRRHVPYDVLDLMRERGLQPVLLSRFEPTGKSKSDNYVVPNVVHYIHFGKTLEFEFSNYLNVLGVHKFMKPNCIIFHGDAAITGKWWNRTVTEMPNLYRVWHRKPTEIHGSKIGYIQHAADITRLEILHGMCSFLYFVPSARCLVTAKLLFWLCYGFALIGRLISMKQNPRWEKLKPHLTNMSL